MKQLEIEYFWPLTQQIPLDLDFTDCEKPRLSTFVTDPMISNGFLISNGSTNSYITTGKLSIDADTTTIKVSEKPNIIRRGLFKALGVKWEKK
ncbi:hypothetical protein UFOVP242_191 [uncultured Caudovirales phage]|uniref:Uncharacterized protein n=1 Tax=uncultured Caudovirales phage TaxID=2100421 RepID=A0A6J7WW48_9CAUD|nr:hypothetical protein UFOVP242_191 [uncultured Caudovirales phage]